MRKTARFRSLQGCGSHNEPSISGKRVLGKYSQLGMVVQDARERGVEEDL